jgi:transcriptional antiterminator Rof (Rho-off)
MDPLEVIQGYKCPLHPDKSKLDSLELSVVYHFDTGVNLNGAHDSLVDAKAQTTVIRSAQFREYIDKAKSITIRLVEDIFTGAEKWDTLKKMESLRPVHEPWLELVEGDGFSWTPPRTDRYTGVAGGAKWGPSSEMLQLARGGDHRQCSNPSSLSIVQNTSLQGLLTMPTMIGLYSYQLRGWTGMATLLGAPSCQQSFPREEKVSQLMLVIAV